MGFSVHGQEHQFRHYGVNEGMANTNVYYAMSDHFGYLWFCTETGVNRFDGKRFETFTIEDGLADNENFSCKEDSKGRIWFASYNGKLSYYKDGVFYDERKDPKLKYEPTPGFIFDIGEDKDGSIWFSKQFGAIYRYDKNGISELKDKAPPTRVKPVLLKYNGEFNVLSFSTKDTLYLTDVCSGKINIRQYAKGSKYYSEHINNQKIDNDIYYLSVDGLTKIQNGKLEVVLPSNKLGFKDLLVSFKIIGNDLWLGTEFHGLYFYPNFLKGNIDSFQHFLTGDRIGSIVNDYEGGLWVTTNNNGTYYLPPSAFSVTNIPFRACYSLAILPGKKSYVVGHDNGSISFFNNNKLLKTYNSTNNRPNKAITIEYIGNDSIFIASEIAPDWFNISDGKYADAFKETKLEGCKDISRFKNKWFIATHNKIYSLDKGGNIVELQTAPLTEHYFYKFVSITAQSDTSFYYATLHQLFHSTINSHTSSHIVSDTLLKSNIKHIAYTDGSLWVATHGNGIYIYRNNIFVRHLNKAKDGIASNVCQRLVVGRNNQIWLATNNGISLIDTKTYKVLTSFSTNDGLINNDVKNISFDSEHVYISTPSGISIFNSELFAAKDEPPLVYISSVRSKEFGYNNPTNLEFTFSNNPINIAFNAITYISPQSLHFRYKIKASDTWTETSEKNIQLVGLASGDYTIEVQAKKYNSSWSKSAKLYVRVNPFWYQSWLFVLFSFGLAIVVLIIFLRIWMRNIRRSETEKTLYSQKITELEMKSLSNQMNPHFMFNSLNTIQDLILEKKERESLNYLSEFSHLMRQILLNSRKPHISLKEELDFLERYLQLERVRFNNKFNYYINYSENLLANDLALPPMLIQPLLENSIKHGINDEKGEIILNLSSDNDFLIVEVIDNGSGINLSNSKKAYPKHQSTAMKVIEERLSLLKTNNEKKGYIIVSDRSSTGDNGTNVKIFIPISY